MKLPVARRFVFVVATTLCSSTSAESVFAVETEEQRLYDRYVSAFDAKVRKAASRTEVAREPAGVAP